ncbi:hypothetical protein SRHO_G00190090 [Serrasalmus rhombeus]
MGAASFRRKEMVADVAQCSAFSASGNEDSGERDGSVSYCQRVSSGIVELPLLQRSISQSASTVTPAVAPVCQMPPQDGWRGQALGVIFWEALVTGSEGTLRARASAGVNVLSGLWRSDSRSPSCWEPSVKETRCLSLNSVDGAESSVSVSCITDHVLQSTQQKSQEQKSF